MKFTADEQILKEAILDVLDSGPLFRPRWEFFEDEGSEGAQTEDGANRDRLDFVDRVIDRIRRAKAPESTPQYPQFVGRFARPRGRSLSVEAERELRDNPPPMVIDDIDERDIPRKLDPRSTSEIVSTLIREVAADLYGLAGYARNIHLRAARAWEHVADIQQRRVSCECFNPVQTAQAATGRANEATKAAPPNVAASTACTTALTACALRDAPAAAEAHRRAAEAYGGSGDDYERLKPETKRRIDAGLLKLSDQEGA